MKRKSLAFVVTMFLMVTFSAVGASAITKKSTIRVEGMKCKMCTSSVEKALKATPGVAKVEVNLQKKEAVVEYDDEKVTEAQLREVINATGFKAVDEKSSTQ